MYIVIRYCPNQLIISSTHVPVFQVKYHKRLMLSQKKMHNYGNEILKIALSIKKKKSNANEFHRFDCWTQDVSDVTVLFMSVYVHSVV